MTYYGFYLIALLAVPPCIQIERPLVMHAKAEFVFEEQKKTVKFLLERFPFALRVCVVGSDLSGLGDLTGLTLQPKGICSR